MKPKHLKEAKRAQVKAAKKERLKPTKPSSLPLRTVLAALFLSFAYAATSVGGVISAQQLAQANLAPKASRDDYAANFSRSAVPTESAEKAQPLEEALSPAETATKSLATVALSYSGANAPTTINFPGSRSDELSSPSRYYSVSSGRFTSMDPASPTQMNPMSWNAYVGLNANPMANTDSTGRYAEAGHYYTTYIVARETGYSHQDSLTLALYSQLPDEVGTYDAIHQPIRGVRDSVLGLGARIIRKFADQDPQLSMRFYNTKVVQTEFHALTGGLSAAETALSASSVINSPTLESAGLAIHRLGDTFAHRVMGNEKYLYATGAGHLLDGHDPDMISTRPALYGDYVQKLTETLSERRGIKLSVEQVAAIRAKLDVATAGALKTRQQRIQNAQSVIMNGLATMSDDSYDAAQNELIDSMEYARAEEDITARLKARAQNEARVVVENPHGMGSMLLVPESADGSYFDAQGQEYENARNFLDASNPYQPPSMAFEPASRSDVNKLLRRLDTSAEQLIETQRRCKRAGCK